MDESLIRNLIAEHLAVPAEAVSDDALFQHDLGADSLDMVQLSMLLESKLGISLDDDEAASCVTIGDALHLLRSKSTGVVDERYV